MPYFRIFVVINEIVKLVTPISTDGKDSNILS